MLVENGQAVGFLGTLFSNRPTPRGQQDFCNLALWHVLPEYRSESLALFMQVLRLKEFTVTNLTGNKVAPILKKFGFQQIDQRFAILPPLPARPALELVEDPARILDALAGDARQVCLDHVGLPGKGLLLKNSRGVCYLMYNLLRKKKLPVMQILYLSDPAFFFANYRSACWQICLQKQLLGLMIGDHFLKEQSIPGALWVTQRQAHLFKSPLLDRFELDMAYSEIQLFDLH